MATMTSIEWNHRPAEDGPAREPVAWMMTNLPGLEGNQTVWTNWSSVKSCMDKGYEAIPLYRSPPLEPFERLVEEWRHEECMNGIVQRTPDEEDEARVLGRCADRLASVLKSARGTKT